MDKELLKNVKKGSRLFLIITVLSIIALLAFTVRKDTFSSLKKLSLLFLCLTTIACLIRMYVECARLQLLTLAFGKRISFKAASEFVIGGYFLSITPFGVGGFPLQFYILMKENCCFGEAGAIIGMRGVTYIAAFILTIPFLIGYKDLFTGTGMHTLSGYIITIYGVIAVFFILVIWKTEFVKNILGKLKEFFIHRSKERFVKWIDKFCDEIDKFKCGLRQCCSKGIHILIFNVILSGVSLFFYVIMVPLLFRGLGIEVPIIKTALIQLILTFLLMFAPTPGGSGIAEGVGFAIYRSMCSPALIGIFVVLWRFFTYYTGVILGGIILLRMLASSKKSN